MTGVKVDIAADAIGNTLQTSYLVMKQLGGAPTEEQAQDYEDCVTEGEKPHEDSGFITEKLECAYEIFGEASMTALVLSGINERNALYKSMVSTSPHIRKRYGKCVAEVVEAVDDEYEDMEDSVQFPWNPGCIRSVFSEERYRDVKTFRDSMGTSLSKYERKIATLAFLSPSEGLKMKACFPDNLSEQEWNQLCTLSASSDETFNWMQSDEKKIEERYQISFGEAEKTQDLHCRATLQLMLEEDYPKPNCFMDILGAVRFASIASKIPSDLTEEELLAFLADIGIKLSELLDIRLCLGKNEEALELVCVRNVLGEQEFEDAVGAVGTSAWLLKDLEAVAAFEKKIAGIVVGEVEEKVGKCVTGVVEIFDGGKRRNRHRSAQALSRLFKTPPKEVQARFEECTNNFSEPLVLSDGEFQAQIYLYLEKIGMPSDEEFKAFHKCMGCRKHHERYGSRGQFDSSYSSRGGGHRGRSRGFRRYGREKSSDNIVTIVLSVAVAGLSTILIVIFGKRCKRQRARNCAVANLALAPSLPYKVECSEELQKKPSNDIESLPSTTFDGPLPSEVI